MVTADRRPEPALDVPISLTASSGRRLEEIGAADTASLGKAVPSLVMTRTGAFTQPFLRGVGKRSTLGVENSVATYVDGVYLASSISALLDLRGVERVEVLNGPQGTLFGRNATGGGIQVVTRDPSPGRSGEVSLGAGSYGYWRGDAYLSGGGDRLAANLALSATGNGGYGINLFTGRTDQGEVAHSLAGRTKWVWRPSSALKLTLSADYQDIDQDFAYRPVEGFPPVGQPRVLDFRDGDQDSSGRFRFRYGGGSARLDLAVGGVDLVSLTAWRRMRARYGNDLDLGPRLLLAGVPTANQDQFSQELQLQSAKAAPVSWVAGLYYIAIQERYDPTLFLYGGDYSRKLGGRTEQILSDLGKVSSYAAYGQATVPLGGATRLTGGLRYTLERRSVDARGERLYDNAPLVRPIPGLPLLAQAPLHESDQFGELTWRASLERRLSGPLMAYVSASRGLQSGGWNLQTPQGAAFGPERLDDVEAGFKYADPSGRLSFDAAAFTYAYSDLQVSVLTAGGSVTTNAASAAVRGIELQLAAWLDDRTELTGGAQLLSARYGRFPNATCTDDRLDAPAPYSPAPCDATGHRLPFAPELKLNLALVRRLELEKIGAFELAVNLAYNSGYFAEPDNVVRQDAFVTLDASVDWRPRLSGPSVRVWALNLTDTQYYDSLVTFPTTGVLQRPAAPRRFGASILYSF